jgi:hypothetical protein
MLYVLLFQSPSCTSAAAECRQVRMVMLPVLQSGVGRQASSAWRTSLTIYWSQLPQRGIVHACAAFRFSTSSGSWPRDPNFQNKMMRTAAATAAAPPP